MKNLGCKVKIKFASECPFKKKTETLRNVTEIHYNYSSIIGKQIAFESDILKTGITYPIVWIKEFETELETKKAKHF